MIIVYIILIIVAVYLFAGLVFAIPFVIKGVTKIDEGAHGSKWGFRIIIIPGNDGVLAIAIKTMAKGFKE